MAGKTSIEWTEHSWNPIVGCSIVSPGCTNCYAMRAAHRIEEMRLGSWRKMLAPSTPIPDGPYTGTTKVVNGNPVWTGKLALAPEVTLLAPLRRKKPTMWFVNSMSDLFHEGVPDKWIDRVFAVMALAPWHTFQVLTKRAERMRAYMANCDVEIRWMAAVAKHIEQHGDHLGCFKILCQREEWVPLPNVWLGVSAEDQTRADERIPHLLATPAAVRFVSAEPLLGPIDLAHIPMSKPDEHTVFRTINALTGRRGHGSKFGYTETCDLLQPHLDWVIAGSESGQGARPCDLDWVRSLRDQCAAASVSFFFKQHAVNGRKISLPSLDGKSWDEMPRRTA